MTCGFTIRSSHVRFAALEDPPSRTILGQSHRQRRRLLSQGSGSRTTFVRISGLFMSGVAHQSSSPGPSMLFSSMGSLDGGPVNFLKPLLLVLNDVAFSRARNRLISAGVGGLSG